MFWWWGGWGWVGGLVSGIFWLAIIIVAVVLLRRELPNLHLGYHHPSLPAVRLLEERYARGEISREEFLHRREVLLQTYAPTFSTTGSPTSSDVPPPPAGSNPSGGEPTEKLPPPRPEAPA
jgi:putative membrane protein